MISAGLIGLKVLTAALAATLVVGTSALTAALPASGAGDQCPTGQPGFTASFWNPYDDWSENKVLQALASQRAVGIDTVIADWSVAQEESAAWFPGSADYSYFEHTIPTLVSAADTTGDQLWMGLIVAPDLFQDDANNWSFLVGELPRFEDVADTLFRQYGASIAGWYIPTEPNQSNVGTYAKSYQYGAWLSQLDTYLHTHDGNKPVMIAADMPSAALSGITPFQFVEEMQPMMAEAHIDVWNFEDGFGMTGWTAQAEAAGFSLAQRYAAEDDSTVWADVFTPVTSTPAQWTQYLKAIAATGTTGLSEWTFPTYMDADAPGASTSASQDYSAYYRYCVG